MKALAIRFLLALAVLLQPISAWCAGPIRIAFIGGLSGPYALQDEEARKNVDMSADIINARGGVLNGKKIEIVTEDNQMESICNDRDLHQRLAPTSTLEQ